MNGIMITTSNNGNRIDNHADQSKLVMGIRKHLGFNVPIPRFDQNAFGRSSIRVDFRKHDYKAVGELPKTDYGDVIHISGRKSVKNAAKIFEELSALIQENRLHSYSKYSVEDVNEAMKKGLFNYKSLTIEKPKLANLGRRFLAIFHA